MEVSMLPGEEFLNRQRILFTDFVECEKSAAHGSDDSGLLKRLPPFGPACGKERTGKIDVAFIWPCTETGTAVGERSDLRGFSGS